MKHKFIISLLVLNELSGIAIAATKGEAQAIGQTILGSVGLLVGILVMWMFVRLGMFRGLKFRHYAFIMLCMVIALGGGYYYGQLGNGQSSSPQSSSLPQG